ncbi:putative acyltransferase domain protein [Mycobacterium kansasii]|uniref:Putative acyltransferase domain protein n=1 Tax=Mycobacterium kansasii TaxID=1768 RepID=A0A1V3W8T3_MYCKA|nr:putative acyltransferase domain protein [Mycobacterium kansasii]
MLRNTVREHPNVGIIDLNKKLCPDGVYTAKVDGSRCAATASTSLRKA